MLQRVQRANQFFHLLLEFTETALQTGVGCHDEIRNFIGRLFDLRPGMIIKRFGLKNPIYAPTAVYGHVGRKPYTAEVTVFEDGKPVKRSVRFFPWEDLDSVELIRKELL